MKIEILRPDLAEITFTDGRFCRIRLENNHAQDWIILTTEDSMIVKPSAGNQVAISQ